MYLEKEILDTIIGDTAAAAADFQRTRELIKTKRLEYKGYNVLTLAVPKIITTRQYADIGLFIEKIYRLFDRIIEHYFADTAYRALFGFDPELEALILNSRRLVSWIPMARIDFFFDEENSGIMMCEINTDGSSGMNEDRLLGEFLSENRAFQAVMQGHEWRRFELFDSWVDEFTAVYEAFRREASAMGGHAKPSRPRVAIVDFLDVGYLTEFEEFARTFERRGIETIICDIRDLSYDGRVLRCRDGMAVDAVYRRAVTRDIIERFAEVQPFVAAVRDRHVCVVGDFVTQIVHNKRLFYILHHPMTEAILTPDELMFVRDHFPATYPLTAENLSAHDVYTEREKWIIKPCDSYGAKGFYAGNILKAEEWKKACEGHLADDYVLQRFHRPHRSENIDLGGGNTTVRAYGNLTGVFCYNGKPYGVYSRLANGEIISTQYDEKTVATVCVTPPTAAFSYHTVSATDRHRRGAD